jgi:uncharacterized protein HemX
MIYIRIAIAIILALALAAFGWKAYHMGMTAVQAEWNAANLKAEAAARATEQQRAQAVQKAQNEHTQNIQIARRDADDARSQLDGLQSFLEERRSNNTSSEPATATDKRTAAVGDVLQQCGQAYQELARRADGHAIDVKLLLNAWPK